MTENCCQLDPARVRWENPNPIAMPGLMWLKDLIQRMNFQRLGIGVFWALPRGYSGEWSGGDHSRCGSKVAWELHIQQEKKPRAQDFRCEVRLWLQSRFWHQSDNPLLKRTWIFLHSGVTHISLAAPNTDLLHQCGTKAWHAFMFPLASKFPHQILLGYNI